MVTTPKSNPAARPIALPPILENIPPQLLDRNQFVAWDYERKHEKWTKIPINPKTHQKASSTDATTWASFEVAAKSMIKNHHDGIGFVLSDNDPHFMMDIDHCITDAGEVSDFALSIVNRTSDRMYWEISPSGTGLRGFGVGNPNLWKHKDTKSGFEIYSTKRFATLTGHIFAGEIGEDATAIANTLHEEVFGPDPKTTEKVKRSLPSTTGPRQTNREHFTDDEILRRVNPNAYLADPRYPSESERDLGFLGHVAFLAGEGNYAQAERVWRLSGLWREKCERDDYVQRTLEKAFDRDKFYDPGYGATHTTVFPVPVYTAEAATDTVCIAVADLQALQAENASLRAQLDEQTRILRNAKLGSTRLAAVAALSVLREEMEKPEVPDDGMFQVFLGRIADRAGISASSAGRQIDKLADAGLLRKRTDPRHYRREGSNLVEFENRVSLGLPSDCSDIEDLAREMARADLATNHGGKREPEPCPNCGEIHDRIRKTSHYCTGCGGQIGATKVTIEPAYPEEKPVAPNPPKKIDLPSLPGTFMMKTPDDAQTCILLPHTHLEKTKQDASPDNAPPTEITENGEILANPPDLHDESPGRSLPAGRLAAMAQNSSAVDIAEAYAHENERLALKSNAFSFGAD